MVSLGIPSRKTKSRMGRKHMGVQALQSHRNLGENIQCRCPCPATPSRVRGRSKCVTNPKGPRVQLSPANSRAVQYAF